MHHQLMTASVHTSSDMSTNLVVIQDRAEVKVESTKAALILTQNEDRLTLTLPEAKSERMQCMKSRLPGYLAELLHIYDSRGEKQIYRIINELESGTDDILVDEDISRVNWLEITSRPAPPPEPENETQAQPLIEQPSSFARSETQFTATRVHAYDEVAVVESSVRAAASISIHGSGTIPPPFRGLPTQISHEVEAPHYWNVLEHVQKQAMAMGNQLRNSTAATPDDIAGVLASLTLESTSLDPARYPTLFGDDFWLSKFRVGAAGELFVSIVIRRHVLLAAFADDHDRSMSY